MAVSELLNTLHGELSANAKVLVDPTNDEFQVALQRWSDTDKKIPGAIVVVASEEDIVKTVSPTSVSKVDRV
jgi:predicted Abi (CAAX) family protease